MDVLQEQLADGGTPLAQLIAEYDWASTSLGPMPHWPFEVKSTVALMMQCELPIATAWGADGVLIYNDAYAKFAGNRHPEVLGSKLLEGWPEAAKLNRRVLDTCLAGQTLSLRDEQLTLFRNGHSDTVWLDLDYSPVRNAHGQPIGVFAVVRETSSRVRMEAQRAQDIAQLSAAQFRQRCLIELGDRLRRCETAPQVAGAVSEHLGRVLGCRRAGYAVISGDYTSVENDWTDGTVASLSGQHGYSALGQAYAARIRSGEILAIPDVKVHEATAEQAERWLAIGVQALLNAPLLENGIAVGMLYAHEPAPRAWTEEEISLVKDMADRTWEAMGRAKAVDALRRMNNTLEAQVRERTLQRDRMWTLSTDLMMVSTHAGQILSVNPAWTKLLGWREDELVGAYFFDFLDPYDVPRTKFEREKLTRGLTIENLENRYRCKDGRIVWISWKAIPDGEIIHSVGRDVTAEHEQAEALQAAEEALRHAQKMEAVGQLTGGIAHDFNNLLQGVLGCLELLQKRIDQGRIEDVSNYAVQARQSAERASALTHRLLAFSRRAPLAPKPVDANALILAMEPLLSRTIGELIRLDFELAPDLWPVLCDPHQLDSAILNLAINSRDAMPEGGTLTIRSVNVPRLPGQAAQLEDKEFICLSVTDTGTGMPPDVVAHAFDPFYTTKPIGQGTGLGLSMVYGFMRQSGGQAKIASKPGGGTTVMLYLPRSSGEQQSEDLGNPQPEPGGQPSTRGTALVLEDEPVVRSIVVEVLEELGFSALEAGDGPAGLELLSSAQPVDLLVTDIGLPGLNGRQVAEAARLLRPDLKILFMTGYAETAAMSTGFLKPGMHMITKPFEIGKLTARIIEIAEIT